MTLAHSGCIESSCNYYMYLGGLSYFVCLKFFYSLSVGIHCAYVHFWQDHMTRGIILHDCTRRKQWQEVQPSESAKPTCERKVEELKIKCGEKNEAERDKTWLSWWMHEYTALIIKVIVVAMLLIIVTEKGFTVCNAYDFCQCLSFQSGIQARTNTNRVFPPY